MRKNLATFGKIAVYTLLLVCAYYFFDAFREFSLNVSHKLDTIEKLSAKSEEASKFGKTVQEKVTNVAHSMGGLDQNTDKESEDTLALRNNLKDLKSALLEQRKADSQQRKNELSKFLRKMEKVLTVSSSHITTTKQPKKVLDSELYLNATYLKERALFYLYLMKRATVVYTTGFYSYPEHNNSRVFYRMAKTPLPNKANNTVFLLHGKTFSSTIWLSIGTLYKLPNFGFDVIAVDLPGYGQSENATEMDLAGDRVKFLSALMRALVPSGQRFLVSPGASGIYAVPMIMSMPSFVKGVVLIAPGFTSKYEVKRYMELNVDVLVFYGEDDTTMVPFSSIDSLEHLGQKRIYVINDAGKDCYADQPGAFHRLLKRFLLVGASEKESAYTATRVITPKNQLSR